MTESKVFTDNFSRSFTESGDFFQFLSDRKARSKWMTAPSRELQFEPVERGSTLGNLYMQIYDHNGAAEILEDTMENTSLLLKVDGKDYPVRSCALKTVLERARISGHALNKVSKSVFAEILNYCMGVASGDSLIKVADEKVSAVHGGDPKDYTVMEMLPLFKATNDFLDREYPGNRFMTAHFDHSIATAIWCLDGQADKLLDTYHREIAAKGLQTEKMVPALRFSTSDVGMSGANLYPIFLVGAESRIVPLGYSIRTEHKNGVDMQYFEEQLRLVYAQFEKALDKQVQLMNIEIRYPVTTLMRVLKRIKSPKKASYSTSDESVPKEARNRSYYHDDKIHFTAIGYHLIATDAVEVELDGTWENSKHGLQLSVSMCKEVVPRDQAGILAYLSSGIIKGIGPETAKAIVARFGDKTMEVLEKEPDKLLSVKGIAQKKLKAIIKSYGETKALSDLMIYLVPFGVSMKKVAMIREEFGDSSLRIVKTDPFQLCKIKGFGFMTVDSIARKTKVSLLGWIPATPVGSRSALRPTALAVSEGTIRTASGLI